jgi:hypothetical protein
MPATEFGGVAYSSAFAIAATVNPADPASATWTFLIYRR